VLVVLAEIEFIFFLAASVRLCFGFVLKMLLITQGCLLLLSSAYSESRPFLLLTPPPEVGRGHS